MLVKIMANKVWDEMGIRRKFQQQSEEPPRSRRSDLKDTVVKATSPIPI